LRGWLQYEEWKVPIYKMGSNFNISVAGHLPGTYMKRSFDQRSKQEQRAKRTSGASKWNRRGQQSKLLLVGSEDSFKSDVTHRIFGGPQFQVAGRSATLLDALARLESGAIDLVVLSCEFREEELSLFAFDAQRRGFAGLILCVVHLSSAVTEAPLTNPHQILVQHVTRGMPTSSELNEFYRPVPFTARQQAVLMRVSEGWTNQQIAQHLKCSEGSVKAILQQLFSKLGVRKRAQIVRMAFEGGTRAIPGRASG
jgi:DNA-binding CsgD family transcriptional regulator